MSTPKARSATAKQGGLVPLTKNQRRRLNKKRRLPHDFKDKSAEPLPSSKKLGRKMLDIVRDSGAADIDRLLRGSRGSKPIASNEALLVAILLTAYLDTKSYLRTAVVRVLAGLHPSIAQELGLCDATGWKSYAYSTVADRIKNLEDKLAAGIYDGGTPMDLVWLARTLLEASIPSTDLADIESAAVDETPVRAFATPVDGKYVSQKKFDKAVEARYRQYNTDNPGVPEAELRLRALEDEATERGLQVGEDGRIIRCKDHDARTGWATATKKTEAHYFIGYSLTLAVACRSAHWSGNPDKIKLGPKIPRYILGLSLNPAGDSPGDVGRHTVDQARMIAAKINEIIADRGYTTKLEKFLRELHKWGINTVMDYTKTVINKPKVINIGSSKTTKQQALVSCGVILPDWINDYWKKPPPHIANDKQKLAKWHTSRARRFRWADKGHVKEDGKPTGAKRFQDPVIAGRATLPSKRKPNSYSQPLVAAPGKAPPHVGGTIIIEVDDLDYYQKTPYGTRAWKKSYGRRNTVESVNSGLKEDEGLHPGKCQAFGLAAHTMAAIALAVAHNLKQTIKAKAKAKKADRADKVKKARKADKNQASEATEPSNRHEDERTATAEPIDGGLAPNRAPP